MSLRDTILKYYSQFTDLCDKNFKFAEYFGPTIVKEMSTETLVERSSNVVYRMEYGSEKRLTVFDMIVIGEFATRVMNSVVEKKNTEEYNTYRNDRVHAFSSLIQLGLHGSNRYEEDSYAALIYNTIMRILNSVVMNITADANKTDEDEERDYITCDSIRSIDFPTAFKSEMSIINAERSYDDNRANHAFNIHKTLIALFGFNYTFYYVLDPKQSNEVHPYTWDEFVNKLFEAMHNDVGNDTLYQILAYYNCACLGNQDKIEFLKQFVSGNPSGSLDESMTMEQYICGFIDTE